MKIFCCVTTKRSDLKVSELLDTVVPNVRDDKMLVAHDGQTGWTFHLAAVRVDGRVQVAAGVLEHLKNKLSFEMGIIKFYKPYLCSSPEACKALLTVW